MILCFIEEFVCSTQYCKFIAAAGCITCSHSVATCLACSACGRRRKKQSSKQTTKIILIIIKINVDVNIIWMAYVYVHQCVCKCNAIEPSTYHFQFYRWKLFIQENVIKYDYSRNWLSTFSKPSTIPSGGSELWLEWSW